MSEQEIIRGDSLERLKDLPDNSFDLVLTDPPYGTTALEWDKVPDLSKLWIELKRLGKSNCAYIFTASQPFTTDLINSNREEFRYCLVWDKVNKYTGAFNANKRPMKSHEDIVVFFHSQPTYNIQFREGVPYTNTRPKGKGAYVGGAGKETDGKINRSDGKKAYPGSILRIEGQTHISNHPTQKPVKLMDWLIRTFTNEGDTILDPFLGSGTTLVACKQLNRSGVGIEISPEYCEIARKRLEQMPNPSTVKEEESVDS